VRGITQVIEVAAGMSGRGLRFTRRYGERLTYIEADLPGMAERKRQTLERMGALAEHHRVEPLDALRESGPESLAEIAGDLDRATGLAILTEGLLGYLEHETVKEIWRRFAGALDRFAHGTYISDIHIGELQDLRVKAFRLMLSVFVRGRVHLHFGNEQEVISALRGAGFASATIHRAADLSSDGDDSAARLAHTLEASTA
jgi:O-methyltransferase involved in polyketide biosynthesis